MSWGLSLVIRSSAAGGAQGWVGFELCIGISTVYRGRAARLLALWWLRSEADKPRARGRSADGADSLSLLAVRLRCRRPLRAFRMHRWARRQAAYRTGASPRSICQGRGKPEPRDCGLTGDIHTVQQPKRDPRFTYPARHRAHGSCARVYGLKPGLLLLKLKPAARAVQLRAPAPELYPAYRHAPARLQRAKAPREPRPRCLSAASASTRSTPP